MRRSEIWLINLDPTVGAEIKKKRPAIIVNDDSIGLLLLKVIVPITDWKAKYSTADWLVKFEPNEFNNLTKVSAADCFQVRSISQQRMIKKIGFIDDVGMKEIEKSLAAVLKIE